MEGGDLGGKPLLPEWRDYQLAKVFGWTKTQIDEQPAEWLDWMLAIHMEVNEHEAAQYERSSREGSGWDG
jgi:hypothetical protein